MNEQKLSLKKLMQVLTETASHACQMLSHDYAKALRAPENKKLIPPPLCVAGIRISFTADVNDNERSEFQGNGSDLQLDFGNPNGNFRGEIVFKPYAPNMVFGYETNAASGIDCADNAGNDDYEKQSDGAEIQRQSGALNENYECSEFY